MRLKSRFWGVYRWILKLRCKFKMPKDFIKMFLKMWKEEFRVQALKLNYHKPEDFTRCCWQKTERVESIWLAYRTMVFLYFLATSLYSKFTPAEEPQKHFIFLTNWTYELEFIQFFVAFVVTVTKFTEERRNPSAPPKEAMPWYYKAYWVLYTVVLPSAIVVSVVFWAFVYDPVLFPADFKNLVVHAFNSFFMLLDFCLAAVPIRFLHFYWPSIYALIYVIFSAIYQASGGTGVKGLVPIYEILDWREPPKAFLTCVFCYFFLIMLHIMFWLDTIVKLWMRKKNFERAGDQR